MSFVDPRWPPPVVPAPRPPRLNYLIAAISALLLLLTVALPAGIGYAWRHRDALPGLRPPTGQAPTSPNAGEPGVDDPYFPNYGNSGYEVTMYEIDVAFDPGTGRLSGTTSVYAVATTDLGSFFLDLVLEVESVTVNGQPAAVERDGFLDVEITPTEPIAAGDPMAVVVRYAGEPAEVDGPGGRSPWSVTKQEWTAAGEPESAAWWFPANDHPSDPALMDVSVRVPKDLQVLSVGRLESRDTGNEADFDTWHWVARQPMATYLNFVSIGRYQIVEGESAGRPYVYAVTEQLSAADRRRALAQLQKTPAVITTLEDWFGPYPFSEIGGVVPAHQLGFGGLENQTRPVYAASAILDDDFAPQLIAHELSHMWFGDNVTVREWNDICTNECWASWGEWAYLDSIGGESLNDHLNRAYAALVENDRFWSIPLDDPGEDHLFDVVYTRGPMMLQALRNRIGDVAFFALARGWAQDPGSRSLEQWMTQAQQVADQHPPDGASGPVDLDPFFAAWIYGTEAPARTPENGFPR